ncbi:follicle cell protein 3C-1 [Drosophila bipectinata]|uniref:follicle cell protein 3C-1 n=1 Tax=Drosophila bipectinata TaxID=42026 RepID=UPI001C8A365B|nr:follicle cell protein 3C-1 [Drosophila bipectinata]
MATFKNTLLFVVILLALHLEASKIAYKKPLYGKTNFIKDKRLKSKPIKEGTTTSSTTSTSTSTSTTTTSTTEENWPAAAPVEFVIVTTPKAILDSTTEWLGRNGSTTEIFSSTPETGSTKTEGESSGEEVGVPPQAESSNEASSTIPMSTTTSSSLINTIPSPLPTPESVQPQDNQPVPCTCGVFLSSQIQNGLPTAPLIHQELDRMFPCNAIGRKQCQTKCLEAIVQHLPNSANIVCSALGHDCHKERAYLFIKNCHNQWVNTNLQAGREYCCRGGLPYRCPLMG